jgi:hypothetical protein
MNIVLWILQVLVGALFVGHAALMLSPRNARLRRELNRPRADVPGEAAPGRPRMQGSTPLWLIEMSPGLRVFAGVAEGLAGLALIFAGLVASISWLVPLAGAGLVVLMLGAIVFHLRRREYPNIGLNAVLLLLSGFVAYMRWFADPL